MFILFFVPHPRISSSATHCFTQCPVYEHLSLRHTPPQPQRLTRPGQSSLITTSYGKYPIILCALSPPHNAMQVPQREHPQLSPSALRMPSVPPCLYRAENNSKVKHLSFAHSMQEGKWERGCRGRLRWAFATIRMDGEMRDGNDKSCASPLCKRGTFRRDTTINQTWAALSNSITIAGRRAHTHVFFHTQAHSRLCGGLCLWGRSVIFT